MTIWNFWKMFENDVKSSTVSRTKQNKAAEMEIKGTDFLIKWTHAFNFYFQL